MGSVQSHKFLCDAVVLSDDAGQFNAGRHALCWSPHGTVSAGTRSDIGRGCRNAFLSLAKTCDKLGIAVRNYLGSRLRVAGHALVEPLDHRR